MNPQPAAITRFPAMLATLTREEVPSSFPDSILTDSQFPDLFRMWGVAFAALRADPADQSLSEHSKDG